MRSTNRQKNKILDDIKEAADLSSRKEAYYFLYSVAGRRFKRFGWSVSHYLNGAITITNDHLYYRAISADDLFTPLTTIKETQMTRR